jgi:hypothetical protein
MESSATFEAKMLPDRLFSLVHDMIAQVYIKCTDLVRSGH